MLTLLLADDARYPDSLKEGSARAKGLHKACPIPILFHRIFISPHLSVLNTFLRIMANAEVTGSCLDAYSRVEPCRRTVRRVICETFRMLTPIVGHWQPSEILIAVLLLLPV
jgi:hypothetical protein